MGEEKIRKGDARVQVIICLFFVFVVAGGVLLCLYIFLPQTESSSWYYLGGIVLEAIPLAFWLFAYIYTCFKPRPGVGGGGGGGKGASPKGGGGGGLGGGGAAWNIPKPPSSRANKSAGSQAAPASSAGGSVDTRRVHFGEVVVVGSNEGSYNDRLSRTDGSTGGAVGNQGGHHSRSNNRSSSSSSNDIEVFVGSREIEMPLSSGLPSCK